MSEVQITVKLDKEEAQSLLDKVEEILALLQEIKKEVKSGKNTRSNSKSESD